MEPGFEGPRWIIPLTKMDTSAEVPVPSQEIPPDVGVVQLEEMSLWRRLRQSGDAAAREQLLARHLPYARVVAATYYAKRFENDVEFADYLQYASVGLLEAMDRFEPDRGAQFRTFAARRMHGAILNGVEKLTERQQQISARQRIRSERMAAVKELARKRAAADAPVPQKGTEQLFKYVSEVGLGLALSWMLEGTSMLENPDRAESIPFYRNEAIRQMRQRLAAAVECLPPQERTVVRCHYMQEMPFEQVATMLNLTKGRVSQIHKQAMSRLREALADHGGLDVTF
jgi:RNA polymerase sigma factor FliA